MTKRIKGITAVLAALLIIVAAGALFFYQYYLVPFRNAQNQMVPSPLTLREQADGTVHITWKAGQNVDRYRVELLRAIEAADPTAPAFEALYTTHVTGATECLLPEFPRDEELTISITGEKAYHFPGEDKWRDSETPITVTAVFAKPAISDLQWLADADSKTVSIQFGMGEETTCRLYTVPDTGEPVFYDTLGTGSTTITFGEGMQFPMPGHDSVQRFAFSAYSQFPGYTHYGLVTDFITVTREDLLGTVLMLECVDQGNNVYAFHWNETKGETYQFQQLQSDGETWKTLYETGQNGERSYTTGHLKRYSDFTFRVVSVGGQTLPDSEFAASPAEAKVSTGASVVYSTIWPQKELEVYSDTQKTRTIGKVKASATYCVLDLKDGMFLIRYAKDTYGYIDSNYCLINLPDMIGSICSYNIANSYASVFMAHGYEIPTVTNTVIAGYERVQLSQNQYLVPLLYPAALKLEKAAFAAMEEGYKLKIYDSFRPRIASATVYQQAEKLVDQPIPENTFSGEPMKEMPTLQEGEVLTYGNLMTDYNRYTLNYFLAAGKSRHNLGVAVDLTLEKLGNGAEVEMQTDIHDLTWYSETKRNNKYANKLSQIMRAAGFGTLVSEWWHFQDGDAQSSLALEYTYNGVSPEGWMKDDTGWRYRRANGSFYKNRTVPIGGESYTFDSNGYLVES